MTNITMQDIDKYTFTGHFDIAASVKADENSTSVKKLTLRIKCVNVPLRDLAYRGCLDCKVPAVNGRIRPKLDTFKEGQVVDVDFTKPATAPVDPKLGYKQYLASLSPEDRKAELERMMKETS